jgi:hypothetical protein
MHEHAGPQSRFGLEAPEQLAEQKFAAHSRMAPEQALLCGPHCMPQGPPEQSSLAF